MRALRHGRAAAVSITGFDDMEIASLMTPGWTTVHFRPPNWHLCRQHLLSRLAGKDVIRCASCRWS